MENRKYSFQDFCKIIQVLRGKDGCPWDKEQTHESLRSCMIEEAYEVVEAIHIFSESGDQSNLQEELGDVLLQVVMHAQIATEEGCFTIEDVIQEVSEKMIRRHPHVFGGKEVKDSSQVLINWEEIKKQEKKTYKELYKNELDQVPHSLPALIRTQKVLKKAEKNGYLSFSKEDDRKAIQDCLQQLNDHSSECEFDVKEIIGGMLFHLTDLARQSHINSEEALTEYLDQVIAEQK